MARSVFGYLASISAALLLASCSPIVDTRGHSVESLDFKQLIVGQTQADDVKALLGTPTVKSNFGDETWYYITQKKETVAVFAPEVKEQHVVAVTFDKARLVSGISEYTKEQGKPVQLVGKTTPTEGHTTTFLEQMLGNFGRFNSPGRGIDPRNLGR